MMDTGHRDVDRDVERSEALRDTLSPARLAELRAMRDADNALYGLADCLKGGPGLDGYAFRADVYCEDCGEKMAREVFKGGRRVDWTTFCDSEEVPQPIFFGESDSAEHCGECGEHLYGEDPEEDSED